MHVTKQLLRSTRLSARSWDCSSLFHILLKQLPASKMNRDTCTGGKVARTYRTDELAKLRAGQGTDPTLADPRRKPGDTPNGRR